MSDFWQGRSVLVTGGCGYIGSHMTRHLVRHGARVRVADSLFRGSLDAIAEVRDQIDFMRVDLTHPDAADMACDGVSTVLHLAANASGIRYSSSHHGVMLIQNGMLALNMMRAAEEAGVERYVFYSSSCVYPNDAPVPTPEAIAENNTPEQGNLGYGWAKRIGEMVMDLRRNETTMKMTALRPVNVCGEGEHYDLEIGHVIPSLIIKAFAAADTLTVMGSGRQTRSFIDVHDLCEITLRVAAEGAEIDVLNVSSPVETTIGQIAEMVVRATGRDDLRIAYDTTQPEGTKRKLSDVSRLQSFLGDYAFTPIEKSIEAMVAEYRETVGR